MAELSPTASNTTEAPTSAATTNDSEDPTLTPYQLDFVTLVHQHFGMYGKVLDYDTAAKDYFFDDVEEFNELIGDQLVINALVERGVLKASAKNIKPVTLEDEESTELAVVQENWTGSVLEPLQLIAANMMLDLIDTRSQKKKLQDIGVSTAKYNLWLKDPNFQAYMRKRAEDMLGENQHEAHLSLLDKVRMGDTKAIELYYEMTGRFTRAGANGSGSNQVIEFNNLLVKILEILDEEINDPQVGARIADRFKSLIGAKTLADELMGLDEPIEIPQVKPNRELSPELTELLKSGGDDYVEL